MKDRNLFLVSGKKQGDLKFGVNEDGYEICDFKILNQYPTKEGFRTQPIYIRILGDKAKEACDIKENEHIYIEGRLKYSQKLKAQYVEGYWFSVMN